MLRVHLFVCLAGSFCVCVRATFRHAVYLYLCFSRFVCLFLYVSRLSAARLSILVYVFAVCLCVFLCVCISFKTFLTVSGFVCMPAPDDKHPSLFRLPAAPLTSHFGLDSPPVPSLYRWLPSCLQFNLFA